MTHRRPGRKRRSRPSFRARVRTFWIVAVVVLAGLGWALYSLATAPMFRITSLAVDGLYHASLADVRGRAAIAPQVNLWLQDGHAIERRVETIPYVRSARLHRSLPASARIDVVERVPDGCVRDVDGRSVTVDAAMHVLQRACAADAALTYLVRARIAAEPGDVLDDPELARLQSDARALSATVGRYRSFSHDAFGDLDSTLANGIAVRFGDDTELAAKQRLIGPILAQLGSRARSVRAVDLRAPATPVVEYRH